MKKKILIVDDSVFFQKQMQKTLITAGYEVATAGNGHDALSMVIAEKPDLVLLDVEMPGMDGFEVCRILREQESNNLMPIIMITSKDDQDDKLIGLELGADDYIVKPFDERELLSRIRNTLRRIERNRSASPLTGLQGNIEIQREINSRISKNQDFSVVYLDIDHFKAYNDNYGFIHGDTVIKLTADIMVSQVKLFGNPDDFCGHIGGDDFVFISSMDKAERICQEIIADFDEKIRELFSPEDLKNGYIQNINRRGEVEKTPLTSISLAIVPCPAGRFGHALEISETATELKGQVKKMTGSSFMIDRRTSQPSSRNPATPEPHQG
ncbi:MAG: response regulator [Christensenellaceae bacterium]|jgi:diguanylate cyclase (GGDEF)-like protein